MAGVSRLAGRLLWVLAVALTVSAQIDPRAAFLERSGWEALRSGAIATAAAAFRDALAADPRNARLHLGAAMAATLEQRYADARADCERALELDPSLLQARSLLGQVLYRMHDVASAIRVYEPLAADRRDPALAGDAQETLDRWRRELDLQDRMQQAVGSHFTISFEGPAQSDLAARALEALDRSYWRIGQLLGVYVSAPIPVVLYTTEQFRDITRSPSWAAGAYDGTIRVPMRGALEKSAELERVLSHEFTHALVHTLAARGIPTWLNEGLATALETGDLSWADEWVARAPRIPLSALQKGFGRFSDDQAQLAYATSAVAARRLLVEAGGIAVANLLRDLGSGADFETAFLHRMQRPFATFEADAQMLQN